MALLLLYHRILELERVVESSPMPPERPAPVQFEVPWPVVSIFEIRLFHTNRARVGVVRGVRSGLWFKMIFFHGLGTEALS